MISKHSFLLPTNPNQTGEENIQHAQFPNQNFMFCILCGNSFAFFRIQMTCFTITCADIALNYNESPSPIQSMFITNISNWQYSLKFYRILMTVTSKIIYHFNSAHPPVFKIIKTQYFMHKTSSCLQAKRYSKDLLCCTC